jgi:hypothetical protein
MKHPRPQHRRRDPFLRVDGINLARVLSRKPPPWPRRHVRSVLAMANALRNDYYRVLVLAAFAPHMPEIKRDTAVQDSVAAAETIPDDYARARVLAALRTGGTARAGRSDRKSRRSTALACVSNQTAAGA